MVFFSWRWSVRLSGFILLVFATAGGADDSLFGSLKTGLAGESSSAAPVGQSRLTLQISPYVYHIHSGAHNDVPRTIGLEWEPAGSSLEYGAAYFRNSFYQDSGYIYVG